jgi:hypothetical protein
MWLASPARTNWHFAKDRGSVIAETFEQARAGSRDSGAGGDARRRRAARRLSGDRRRQVESRLLATKREIKELRERVGAEREALERLAHETAAFEQTIAHAFAAARVLVRLHRQEKAIVSVEAQLNRASDDVTRC